MSRPYENTSTSAGAANGMTPREPVTPSVVTIEEIIPKYFTPLVRELVDVTITPHKGGTRIEALGITEVYLKRVLISMNFTPKP